MCAKRKGKILSMRKVREVLRLAMVCNMGNREIARSCFVSHGTVGNYLRLAAKSGLTYCQIKLMDDGELRRMLKDKSADKPVESRPQPDWAWVHQEMKKKGVTLTLLWEEYRDIHPDGYQSTQFCELYRRYKGKLSPSMRQNHKAGERMFTDYASQTVPIVDGKTGLMRDAEVFVAVLEASNYTYAEATWDQSLPNWIGSHAFFRLAELNEAISELLEKLNERPFKKLKGSWRSWFESMERDMLKSLPEKRYELAE